MSAINRLALPPGTLLNDYQIQDVLGQGGFGITYRGMNTALDQIVAVKEYLPGAFAVRDGNTLSVHPSGADSEDIFHWGLKRFLEEARILARLSHPNIVRVLFYMNLNETGYMVMEFLEGQTLGGWLQARGDQPLTQQEILQILDPVTDALALVHDNGLAHRDIKPDNIFMRHGTTPVLIDFGAARNVFSGQSQTVAAIVTPGYSPNEQYSGVADQGPWTDIYALGAVVYRMVTGGSPPDAPSRIAREMAGEQDPCESLLETAGPAFDPAFLQAIDWALKLRPNERPQSVRAWREALDLGVRVASTPTNIETAPATFDDGSRRDPSNRTTTAQSRADFANQTGSGGRSMPGQDHVEPRKSSLIPVVSLAAVILMIVLGGAIWFLVQPDEDRIGNSQAQAFPFGRLTSETETIRDAIGGDDPNDFVSFDVESESEVKFAWDGGAPDAELKLFGADNQPISLLPDGDSLLAEIAAGDYFLEISSNASLSESYTLQFQSKEISGENRPGATPRTALDLAGRGKLDGMDVLFDGPIWPRQREHFFKLSLPERSRVSVALEISSALGSLSFTDASGIASATRDIRKGSAEPLISDLSAGVHYIAVATRSDTPWRYCLKVKTEALPESPVSGGVELVAAEEGASFETAQILPDLTGDVQAFDVRITDQKRERYFKLRAQEAGLLSTRAAGEQFSELEVFRVEGGGRVARAAEQSSLSLRTNVAPGSYILKLTASRVPADGKLTVAFAPGSVSGVTADNPIVLGQLSARLIEETGKLTQRLPEKWFSFDLKDDLRVMIEMTGESGGPLPVGTVLSVRDTAGASVESLLVRRDGEILLREVSLKSGRYALKLSASDAETTDYALRLFAVAKLAGENGDGRGSDTESKGSAIVNLGADTKRLDALLLAKAKARAAAIASASGGQAKVRTDEAGSAAHYLNAFDTGIPYREKWEAQWLSRDRLAASVVSRVRLLKDDGDNFTATLGKARFLTNERIPISLKSADALQIGLFAWQVDGTIGRIYPQDEGQSFTLQQGKDMEVTRQLGLTVASAPLPGENASDEAVIVLACGQAAPFAELAPTFAELASSSLTRAIEATVFLDRLASFCPGSLRVRVLDYRVENPGG